MSRSDKSPPQLFLRFLRWFCNREWLSSIEGDLTELYRERLASSGRLKADVAFAKDVLLLFRPAMIRHFTFQTSMTSGMFRSYFRIGWRNLLRSKVYSFINIGGFSAGMAVSIIIALWLHDELSFNTWFKNYDRIAQVTKAGYWQGKYYQGGKHVPFPLIHELRTTYASNFKHVVPVSGMEGFDAVLSTEEKMLTRRGMYIGEEAPEMFTWQMVQGTREGLQEFKGVMISESTAKAFFGDENPMRRTMRVNNYVDVMVSGVFKDFPKNTAFYGLQFFQPWEFYLADASWVGRQGWDNNFLNVFVELAPGKSLKEAGENLFAAQYEATKDLENMKHEAEGRPEVHLHPMRDWHLFSDYRDGELHHGPIQFVWFIGCIGVFILVLACINFMNLSTARSAKRAKEVGIRKTIGSVRSQLIAQFYSESFLVVAISFLLALIFVYSALPWFNQLAAKDMRIPWENQLFWAASISFLFATGVLSGTYPAIYLSSFNATKILKGVYRAGRFSATPRKVLVVVQFSVSLMLIICTTAIYDQLLFVKSRPVGYARNGLMMIRKNSEALDLKREALREALKATGMVSAVAESGGNLMATWSHNVGFTWEGKDPSFDPGFATLNVSDDFGETVGWELLQGRDFSSEIASDSAGIILNEAAARYMKVEDPVGMTIHWTNNSWNVDQDYHVLGVVRDMIMNSPFDPVMPAIYLNYKYGRVLMMKITPGVSPRDAIPHIERTFRQIIPDMPFDYQFADNEFAAKFSNEERIGELAAVFTTLGIVINCLGLLGLAAYIAEQRTKEIGIRKVLGATIANVWHLLSREFVVLVICSCIIAIPISWMILQKGLQNYEYRKELEWWIFAMAGAGVLVLTLLTVSYQAARAALVNPVKSLRSE